MFPRSIRVSSGGNPTSNKSWSHITLRLFNTGLQLAVSRRSSGGNGGELIIGAKGALASSGEVTLVGMVSEMCEEDGEGVDVSMTESRALRTDNIEGVSITSRSNDLECVVALALAGVTSLRIGGGYLKYVANAVGVLTCPVEVMGVEAG